MMCDVRVVRVNIEDDEALTFIAFPVTAQLLSLMFRLFTMAGKTLAYVSRAASVSLF